MMIDWIRRHSLEGPIFIWLFSVILILSTTTASPFLEGTDIHLEYYFANQNMTHGWDTSIPHAYNSSLLLGFVAPLLGHIFPLKFVFSWIFPLFYSLAPVVLYYILKRFLSHPQAIIGAFLFMVIPTFFIEVTGIAKEQVAEVFFLLCILFVTSKRYALALLFGLLTTATHYSMGFLLAFFLIIYSIGTPLLAKVFHKPFSGNPIKMAVVTLAFLALSGLYLGNVAQGVALSSATYVGSSYVSPNGTAPPVGSDPDTFITRPGWQEYLDISQRDPIVKTAVGLDFMDVPIEGKAFRIIQFSIQLLVIAGVFVLVFRKRPAEITALVGGSCLLLLACLFVPNFASILNPSRFYHIAFFFLPVAFMIGSATVFRKLGNAVASLIVCLFLLFSSGYVFEALQLKPNSVDIPYSIVFSHNRLDIGTKYTDTDFEAARWLASQYDLPPVYADIYGLVIIQEELGLSPLYLIDTTGKYPDDCYIFLRAHNNRYQTVTLWIGAGLRETVSIHSIGIVNQIMSRPILFYSGGSMVLGKVS